MNVTTPNLRAAGATVAVAAALLLASCSRGDKAFTPPPVPVVTAQAAVRTIPYQVDAIGTVDAFNTVSIRSQVGGVVSRVYFKEGDTVKKGDRLFLVEPAPFEAALQAAEAQLARDRVNAQNLDERLQRYDELLKKDYITAQEHSDMVAALDAMRATVQEDEANVKNARLNLGYCSIESPIDGRVGTRMIDEGNVVKANGDTPMVVIHQMRPILVEFSVPRDSAAAHLGHLTFVDNAVDPSTGTILLKAEFPNDDTMLWPGAFVNVTLVLTELHDSVVVPTQAVGTGQNGDYIFVVGDDATVEMRPVKVTYRLGDGAVLESGVASGEKVVVDGQLRLRPGSKVVEKAPVDGGKAANS